MKHKTFRHLSVGLSGLLLLGFFQNCGGFNSSRLPASNSSSLGSDGGITPVPEPVPDGPVPVDPVLPIDTNHYAQVVLALGNADVVNLSCDGGDSFPYSAANATVIATMSDGEIGHSQYSMTGAVFANGVFYKLQGWGVPTKLMKSSDGLTWQLVYQFTDMLTGLWVKDDHIVAADDGHFWQSSDGGKTFALGNIDSGARHLNAMTYENNGTKMLAFGDGSMIVSSDLGSNWKKTISPSGAADDSCAWDAAFGNGILIAIGHTGNVCKSTDDGKTWVTTTKLDGFFSNTKLQWTGNRFRAYPGNQSVVFESTNGVTWTKKGLTGIYPFNQTIFFKNPITGTARAYISQGHYVKSVDPDATVWEKLDADKQPPAAGLDIAKILTGKIKVEPGHPCYK